MAAVKKGFKPPIKEQNTSNEVKEVSKIKNNPKKSKKTEISLTNSQYESLFNAVINPSQKSIPEDGSPSIAKSPERNIDEPIEGASLENSQKLPEQSKEINLNELENRLKNINEFCSKTNVSKFSKQNFLIEQNNRKEQGKLEKISAKYEELSSQNQQSWKLEKLMKYKEKILKSLKKEKIDTKKVSKDLSSEFKEPTIVKRKEKFSQSDKKKKGSKEKKVSKKKISKDLENKTLQDALDYCKETNSESLNESYSLDLQEPSLSYPDKHIRHKDRLKWLQKRRIVGLWVQCDRCDKWRWLENTKDPTELPEFWYCHMNPDPEFNSCTKQERGPGVIEEEDLIHNLFTCGSVVWGRVPGYPWWPAMVDDDPDTEQYYWLDGYSDIPTYYHVVFFDSDQVTRFWLTPKNILPYRTNPNMEKKCSKKILSKFGHRLQISKRQAEEALELDLAQRLETWSFLSRWKNGIRTPLISSDDSDLEAKTSKKRTKKSKNRKQTKYDVSSSSDEFCPKKALKKITKKSEENSDSDSSESNSDSSLTFISKDSSDENSFGEFEKSKKLSSKLVSTKKGSKGALKIDSVLGASKLGSSKRNSKLGTSKRGSKLGSSKRYSKLGALKRHSKLSETETDEELSTSKTDAKLSTPKAGSKLSTSKPDSKLSTPKADSKLSISDTDKKLNMSKTDGKLSKSKMDSKLSTTKTDSKLSTSQFDENFNMYKSDEKLNKTKMGSKLSTSKADSKMNELETGSKFNITKSGSLTSDLNLENSKMDFDLSVSTSSKLGASKADSTLETNLDISKIDSENDTSKCDSEFENSDDLNAGSKMEPKKSSSKLGAQNSEIPKLDRNESTTEDYSITQKLGKFAQKRISESDSKLDDTTQDIDYPLTQNLPEESYQNKLKNSSKTFETSSKSGSTKFGSEKINTEDLDFPFTQKEPKIISQKKFSQENLTQNAQKDSEMSMSDSVSSQLDNLQKLSEKSDKNSKTQNSKSDNSNSIILTMSTDFDKTTQILKLPKNSESLEIIKNSENSNLKNSKNSKDSDDIDNIFDKFKKSSLNIQDMEEIFDGLKNSEKNSFIKRSLSSSENDKFVRNITKKRKTAEQILKERLSQEKIKSPKKRKSQKIMSSSDSETEVPIQKGQKNLSSKEFSRKNSSQKKTPEKSKSQKILSSSDSEIEIPRSQKAQKTLGSKEFSKKYSQKESPKKNSQKESPKKNKSLNISSDEELETLKIQKARRNLDSPKKKLSPQRKLPKKRSQSIYSSEDEMETPKIQKGQKKLGSKGSPKINISPQKNSPKKRKSQKPLTSTDEEIKTFIPQKSYEELKKIAPQKNSSASTSQNTQIIKKTKALGLRRLKNTSKFKAPLKKNLDNSEYSDKSHYPNSSDGESIISEISKYDKSDTESVFSEKSVRVKKLGVRLGGQKNIQKTDVKDVQNIEKKDQILKNLEHKIEVGSKLGASMEPKISEPKTKEPDFKKHNLFEKSDQSSENFSDSSAEE